MGQTATTVEIKNNDVTKDYDDNSDGVDYRRMSKEALIKILEKEDRSVRKLLADGWEVDEVLRKEVFHFSVKQLLVQVIFKKEGIDDCPDFERLYE